MKEENKKESFNLYCFVLALLISILLAGTLYAAEHVVNMEGWLFKPDKLEVKAGDTVIWKNIDDTTHDIYFEDEAVGGPTKDDPQIIRINKDFRMTFNKPGEYVFICKRHNDYDMRGKLTVK